MATAAVIGCGDVSSIHLEAISAIDGIDLVGVCDIDPDRLAVAEKTLAVPGFADHRQLIDSVLPDVVHICTPHDQHVQPAIDCLEWGVHVITEKPLAHTIKDGQRLIEAADQTSTKIAVCFQNRYNAAVAASALRACTDLPRKHHSHQDQILRRSDVDLRISRLSR